MSARLMLLASALLASLTIFSSTGASAQGAPLFAVLNGGNECTNPGPVCRKGDLKAYGSATFIFPTTTSICFGVVVDNMGPANAMHIHRGPSGVVGGIVITLAPLPIPPVGSNPGTSSGCVNGVAAALIAQIKADPTDFYVNVLGQEHRERGAGPRSGRLGAGRGRAARKVIHLEA